MSLKTKLIICLLTVSLFPLGIICVAGYFNIANEFISHEFSALESAVDQKLKSIENYFYERQVDMEAIQGYYNIQRNLPILDLHKNNPEHPEYQTSKAMLDKQLDVMRAAHKYVDIMLLNREGIVVYSNNRSHIEKDLGQYLNDPDGKAYKNGKTGIYLSEFFINKADGSNPGMLITGPANNLQGTMVGVIALEIDLNSVYKLIQDRIGYKHTGETLIGKKYNDEVLFLNPLRYDNNAIFKNKIALGSPNAFPIQEAVSGRNGSGIATDYRNKKVIAVWRYSTFLKCGLVGKIDVSEIMAHLNQLIRIFIFILLSILVFIILFSFFLSKTVFNPIEQLIRGTKLIGEGNFDVTVGIRSKDEIGSLSRAIDNMTKRLKTITVSQEDLQKEVHERKKTEAQLRKLSRAVEQSPATIMITDQDGIIQYVNPKFTRSSGYEAKEAIGQNPRFLKSEKQPAEVFKNLWQSILSGQEWRGELCNKKKNGDIYWELTSISE